MRAVRWLIDTAGSITGTRFRLVIASSSTATALIIGSSLASGGDSGLASQLMQALAALGGPSSTPASTAPAPIAPIAAASKGGGGGVIPASSVPVSSPSPAPTPAVKTPKTTTPKAGRVKHVFVITLNSPGYDNAFGAQSEMPYLANTLRPQGELLSNYSLLTDRGLPNYIGMIGGQSPNALTSGQLHQLHRLSGKCPARPQRERLREWLHLSDAGDQRRRPALRARFSWGAYMEDMGKPEPVPQGETAPANPPQTCVRPDVGAADPSRTSARTIRAPDTRAAAMRSGTTRSRTSTHSSIWGVAHRRTFRSTVWVVRSRAGRRTSPSSRRTSATPASPPSAMRTSRIRDRLRRTSSWRSGSRRSRPHPPTSRTAS